MAYSLLTCLPCDVAKKIVDRGSELLLKERLKKGWGLIHDEMMWRESHHYSCTYHFCDVAECGCYTRYPGFLLRRVDARVWLAGEGETRFCARLEAAEVSNAIWIDFDALLKSRHRLFLTGKLIQGISAVVINISKARLELDDQFVRTDSLLSPLILS